MSGIYFALRSSQEHRDLEFNQFSLTTINGKNCIKYAEKVSKNNPGGLKHRKIEQKTVTHYENLLNPLRCFVTLFKLYVSHCPPADERKNKAFYLTPLKKLKGQVWYSNVPVGHNTLANTVNRICKKSDVQGYKTNHSLRVTAATRLYQAGVDEQLIMKRTGHRSIEGVRLYKRPSEEQDQEVSSLLHAAPDSADPPSKRPKILEGFGLNISNCTNVNISLAIQK